MECGVSGGERVAWGGWFSVARAARQSFGPSRDRARALSLRPAPGRPRVEPGAGGGEEDGR